MAATAEQEHRMEELQRILREASDAYYNRSVEIMGNYEYDALYDELVALEGETGVILDGSITQGAGVEADTGLPKVRHATPMLSLAKTKDRSELADWLHGRAGCMSWKLDGSTAVAHYRSGRLAQVVTRGNGIVGEDITAQARRFHGMPHEIPFDGDLVVRGEALMSYAEFERVNATQPDTAKYANPRNLASGTMRAEDPSVLDGRRIEFHPFTLVSADGYAEDSYAARLDWLATLGFEPVEHVRVEGDGVEAAIAEFESRLPSNPLPSDGLVLFFDDVAYGESLGSTGHAPRNGIAFKWRDATAETTLRGIVWSPSRTGRLNPVAVFDPVELEGTTVGRASAHNVTYVRDMALGLGDRIDVYKSNMIIPQIARNRTRSLRDVRDVMPDACPACGGAVSVRDDHGSEFLVCDNPDCPAKRSGSLAHFASRDALDIRGLSGRTIDKLVEGGFVASFADILGIAGKRDRIVGVVEGIGERSFDNLARAVERARHTEAARFLYALGIREVGRSACRNLCRAYGNDIGRIVDDAVGDGDFEGIDGFGPVMARELREYMRANERMVRGLLGMVVITDAGRPVETQGNGFVSGRTFVVTGALRRFANRDAFKGFVEARGGKVAGSVSRNTDYLVTNTPDSGSSKNRKARELGVDVITEDEFRERAGA